ncbi:MAG: PIG-L deacetylase family protein [Vicinamibacterales bacterium]
MRELSSGPVRSLLCLGAHCDDIEIGAGATILKLVAEHPGLRVHWVVFSSTDERANEARASAAEFLATADDVDVQVKAFTDGFFPAEYAAIKRYFETLKDVVNPDLVLTHYRDDRHQDHRVISDLTWNTFRDHLVLEYEVPKFDGDLGQPNVFVPVDDAVRAAKVQLLLHHYGSQSSKHWFTADTFNAMMRIRGLECRSGTGYAEAFHARKVVLGR